MGTPAELLARIQERMILFDLSEDAVGRAAGHRDAVRNLRRSVDKGNSRGLSDPIVASIAAVLECAPSWLRCEPGAPEPAIPTGALTAKLAEKAELAKRMAKVDNDIRVMKRAGRTGVSTRKPKMR